MISVEWLALTPHGGKAGVTLSGLGRKYLITIELARQITKGK
jgi:hypothetical protein